MYVLGTEGHIPLCTPLTKTNEHKAWSREWEPKAFLTAEETKGKKWGSERERENKKECVCVCAPFVHILGCIHRLSTQLPACVPAHERSPAYSRTCVSNERWTALLSILSSGISHDVTMNPSWTHLCQKALLQPSLSLPHFLFHLSLLHAPFLLLEFFTELPFFHSPLFIFPYSSTFPLSRPCIFSLAEAHKLFFPSFFFGMRGLIESPKKRSRLPKMPGCSDYHKLCLSCGFTKKMLWVHEGKPKNKSRKNEE